ncbi:MAG: hypothetical protein ABIT83_07865, partial [Massilia sp.]
MGALLRKEWRELRWMLLGVLLIGALAVAGLLVRSDRGGSPLLAYFDMITKFAPLLAPLLAN